MLANFTKSKNPHPKIVPKTPSFFRKIRNFDSDLQIFIVILPKSRIKVEWLQCNELKFYFSENRLRKSP